MEGEIKCGTAHMLYHHQLADLPDEHILSWRLSQLLGLQTLLFGFISTATINTVYYCARF